MSPALYQLSRQRRDDLPAVRGTLLVEQVGADAGAHLPVQAGCRAGVGGRSLASSAAKRRRLRAQLSCVPGMAVPSVGGAMVPQNETLAIGQRERGTLLRQQSWLCFSVRLVAFKLGPEFILSYAAGLGKPLP